MTLLPPGRLPDRRELTAPAIIQEAGPAAAYCWDEFFSAMLANPYTRRNYLHAVRRFLQWSADRGLPLDRITPGDVGRYMREHPGSVPTRKLHLAALRAWFDLLVNRHVCILNPAATARGDRYSAVEGKTPEITPAQACTLLGSIDTSRPVGLRDNRRQAAGFRMCSARLFGICRFLTSLVSQLNDCSGTPAAQSRDCWLRSRSVPRAGGTAEAPFVSLVLRPMA